MYLAQEMPTPPKLERLQNMLGLTQYMWQHQEIPEDLVWEILVFIPEGNTNTWGIILL